MPIPPNPLKRAAEILQNRDRWRRRAMLAQGIYYLACGAWPLIHFQSFADAAAVATLPFQAQTFGAVLAVLGASLLEAARREPPGVYPTALGIAVASAIALTSLVWLPRLGGLSFHWFDVIIQTAFAIALVLLYPRAQAGARSTFTRRR